MTAQDLLQQLAAKGGFVNSLLASLLFITLSEIGDKTFFIAAILAMRHSRMLVLSGAVTANTIMFILTVALGYVLTAVPHKIMQLVSSVLFTLFGIQMIREGWTMSPNESEEELEEAKEEINKRENHLQENSSSDSSWRSSGLGLWPTVTSSTFVRAFSLTFVAEWGDRSQIATFLLGASQDVTGVLIGGLLGHTLCTGFAVISGHFAASYLSLPKVHMLGGLVFLMFAVTTFFMG